MIVTLAILIGGDAGDTFEAPGEVALIGKPHRQRCLGNGRALGQQPLRLLDPQLEEIGPSGN
jgi:hypothetical protein